MEIVYVYAGILFFVAVMTYVEVQLQKVEIRKALSAKGAKNIHVSWVPFDFDASNHTYTVEYQDLSGTKRKRSCKIHIFWSGIYWGDEE